MTAFELTCAAITSEVRQQIEEIMATVPIERYKPTALQTLKQQIFLGLLAYRLSLDFKRSKPLA